MSVDLKLKKDELTAILDGEIDHHCARKLREEIDEAAEHIRPRRLILDFSGVSFMDSSGVGLILGRCRLMSLWKGRVTIRNVPEKLKRIVSLAGLSELCDIEEGVSVENETDE